MKLSVAEFAARLIPPISRQTLNSHVTRGALIRGADKKIDTDHPTNAAWLQSRLDNPPPVPTIYNPNTGTGTPRDTFGNVLKPTSKVPPRPLAAASTGQPDRRYQSETEGDLENIDADEVLAYMSTFDIRRFSKSQVDKLRSMESMLKTRVEREHKRRELIERALVQTVFAKLYQIDAAELGIIGSRLAASIAGVFGVDDAELILKVEQMIDIETMKVRKHIKRTLHDFLVKQGSEGISDE